MNFHPSETWCASSQPETDFFFSFKNNLIFRLRAKNGGLNIFSKEKQLKFKNLKFFKHVFPRGTYSSEVTLAKIRIMSIYKG